MAGVISGMLIASFKLFVDGISDYAKGFEVNAAIATTPGQMSRIPFTSMKAQETSMPNILYRMAKGSRTLGGQQVQDGDYVLTCQGSAMADGGGEWFYGDRTPTGDELPKAPHFCPGYLLADAMLGTMSTMMLEHLPDLRRTDGTGRVLDFDFAGGAEVLAKFEAMAKAMANAASPARAKG